MVENLILAKDVAEALALKKEQGATFLAGGTEINRLNSLVEANSLVALTRVPELNFIKKKGSYVEFGAMCSFQKLVDASETPEYFKKSCLFMASRTKRNMATLGGNIAICRDDSYLWPTLLACDASLNLIAPDGEKSFVGVDFYLENHEELKDHLIFSVVIPSCCNLASKRYSNTAQSHAVLTMSASYGPNGLKIAVALKKTGIFTMPALASRISEGASDEEVQAYVKACEALNIEDDLLFGSAAYKRYLLAVTAYDLSQEVLKAAAKAEAGEAK
jgi:putative selenate reductase FAD-binding subunit